MGLVRLINFRAFVSLLGYLYGSNSYNKFYSFFLTSSSALDFSWQWECLRPAHIKPQCALPSGSCLAESGSSGHFKIHVTRVFNLGEEDKSLGSSKHITFQHPF